MFRRRAAKHGVAIELAADGDARIVRAADLALVAAGTATLETALLGTPMLILYRVSRLTYAVARRLVKVPVDRPRERRRRAARGAGVRARAALGAGGRRGRGWRSSPIGEARAAQLAAFREVAARLGGPGAAERAAEAILAELDQVTAATPAGASARASSSPPVAPIENPA